MLSKIVLSQILGREIKWTEAGVCSIAQRRLRDPVDVQCMHRHATALSIRKAETLKKPTALIMLMLRIAVTSERGTVIIIINLALGFK